MNAIQDRGDPSGVALVHVGLVGHHLGIREQHLDVRDAIVLSMTKSIGTERAGRILLGGSQERSLVLMAKHDALGGGSGAVVFKDVRHWFSFFRRMSDGAIIGIILRFGIILIGGTFAALIQRKADQAEDDVLLILIQTDVVQNIAIGSLAVVLVGDVLVLVFLVGFFILRILEIEFLAMEQVLIVVDDRLILKFIITIVIGMSHSDVLDERAGVRSGQDQAHLADVAMDHVRSILPEMVGVDGQRRNIAVFHGLLGVLSALGVIEEAVAIHAVLAILQDGVTKHVLRRRMVVLIDQRHLLTIAIGKGIMTDDATIGATKIVTGRVSAEVTLHTDYSFLCSLSDADWSTSSV